ncbi:MAG: glycosyltransferase, partial [Candidatus Falkowbacteria bacterium]|nr:glycosyltransferase [Candidatus Falkowbacteria bacterium]
NRLLESIWQADLNEINYEIIVVENNSGDDLSNLNKLNKKINLIESPKNLGMGGGNNLGIDSSSGNYILILNPDTIVGLDSIKILYDYLNNDTTVGLVGPKLIYPDASLQYSCSKFPIFWMPILRRTFLGDYFSGLRDSFTMNDFDHNSIKAVDWLMGSCLMFKKKIVLANQEIFSPHFDKRYFMYFEDTDLCRSIWIKGLKVIYNPEAVVVHNHGRDSARHPWYIALLKDKITWIHIFSLFKYFAKWGIKKVTYGQ